MDSWTRSCSWLLEGWSSKGRAASSREPKTLDYESKDCVIPVTHALSGQWLWDAKSQMIPCLQDSIGATATTTIPLLLGFGMPSAVERCYLGIIRGMGISKMYGEHVQR